MRARAIFVAWMLLAQTVAPSLALAATVRAACCCAGHGEKKCHCPVCSKTRAIEEGHAVVASCGGSSGHAIAPSLQTAVSPAPLPEAALAFAAPGGLSSTTPPFPTFEVPTPPPLA